MDQWKAAFKQIYGKTPTKRDFSAAPLSIRTELPKSINYSKEACQKRKRLTLKAEEFGSPIKLRKSSDSHTKFHTRPDDAQNLAADCEQSVPSSSDFVRLIRAPSPLHKNLPFLSPVKNWSEFLGQKQSVHKMNATIELSADLLKTPSPARIGKRSIICANVGQLLTPEKSVDAMDKNGAENGQSEEMQKAQIADGITTNEAETPKEVEGKKKCAKRKSKKQKITGNFLAINLRRRHFAPISKVKGGKWKKNWKKFSKKR